MQVSKNNSFFKELFISIKDFDKYEEFAINKSYKSIFYIIKIIIIFTIVVSLAFTYKIHLEKNKLAQYINENITNINYENEKLSINNNNIIVSENHELINSLVVVDTSSINEEILIKYKEKVNEQGNGFIILNDKILIKTELDNDFNTVLFSDLLKENEITKFDKQDILSFINGKEVITFYLMFFAIMNLYLFFIYFVTIVLNALILSVLGRLTSTLLKIPLKYSATFNIAIHALTLPIILNLIYIVINIYTGFTIKYFQIMYSAISYVYIITAILMIKADFIKRQLELNKVLEEQQKIREEYEKNVNKENNNNIENKIKIQENNINVQENKIKIQEDDIKIQENNNNLNSKDN